VGPTVHPGNDGNARKAPRSLKFSPNPNFQNKQIWALKDAHNERVAIIEHKKAHEYVIYRDHTDANGLPDRPITTTRQRSEHALVLSGRGCMESATLESDNALVYVGLPRTAKGTPKNKDKDGKRPEIRGFVDRDAYLPNSFGFKRNGTWEHEDNDKFIDSFSVRCNKTSYTHKTKDRNGTAFPMPGFGDQAWHLNRNSARVGYHNYQSPHSISGADTQGNVMPDLLYGVSGTGGVSNGGVTQTVLKPGTFRVGDQIGYRDHNVPCYDGNPDDGLASGQYIGTWRYVDANRGGGRPIWTWVVVRSPAQEWRDEQSDSNCHGGTNPDRP
jgi:hypothetical protein